MLKEDGFTHEAYLEMAVLISLCAVALAAGQCLHRLRIHWLPESGLTILIGFAFAMLESTTAQGRAEEHAQKQRYFDPVFFNLILLPPIIFESGYHLNLTLFFANLRSITLFAVVGTLLATAFTWVAIYYAGENGWTPTVLPIREAGAFAALISAVDPVATLATFGALKVDHELHCLVFGESVLNDAVSLILFSAISSSPPAFTPAILPSIGLDFVRVCVLSLLCGIGTALIAALAFRLLKMGRHGETPITEVVLFLTFSYLSFVLPEVPHLAAIVSSLFAGVFMALFAAPNLSAIARRHLGFVLKSLAVLCDTLIFLLVGLALVVYVENIDFKLVGFTILACLVGRVLQVFLLSAIVNRCRPRPIPLRFQAVMAHSGLRGAIAVALAVQMHDEMEDKRKGATVVATTMVTVLLTVFGLGGSTKMLLDRLRIDQGVPPYEEDPAMLRAGACEALFVDPRAGALCGCCATALLIDPLVDADSDLDAASGSGGSGGGLGGGSGGICGGGSGNGALCGELSLELSGSITTTLAKVVETSSKVPPARRAGSASCRLLAGWLGLVAGVRDTGAAPAVVTAFTQP